MVMCKSFLPFRVDSHCKLIKKNKIPSWRRMRRASDERFNKGSVKAFYEKQTAAAVLLVYDWLAQPAQWDRHLRHAAGSMIMSIVYGYPTIRSEHDHTIDAVDDFTKRIFRAAYPGTYLVEFFPWMRHVPSRWVPSIHYNR